MWEGFSERIWKVILSLIGPEGLPSLVENPKATVSSKYFSWPLKLLLAWWLTKNFAFGFVDLSRKRQHMKNEEFKSIGLKYKKLRGKWSPGQGNFIEKISVRHWSKAWFWNQWKVAGRIFKREESRPFGLELGRESGAYWASSPLCHMPCSVFHPLGLYSTQVLLLFKGNVATHR